MKQIISNKSERVFECMNCYTKFKTDEWVKEEFIPADDPPPPGIFIFDYCPNCGKRVRARA
jgi:transcription initiation factor IIE alpha subunit